MKARWDIPAVVTALSQNKDLTQDARSFLGEMIESGELAKSLQGDVQRDTDTHTGITELLRQGKLYRDSNAFAEMINFCAKFREYAPFNNLLVKTQNPSCSYYATQAHWRKAFDYRIRINSKPLSSTNAGFATIDRLQHGYKMRIVIHEELDDPSRFGVLCHELAHIFLGHLGNDNDHWWPNRWNIDQHSIEVEAEATAFIVTWRLGLRGESAAYVSRHMPNGKVPKGASADHIAKVAGRIEQMCCERLPVRSPKKRVHSQKR